MRLFLDWRKETFADFAKGLIRIYVRDYWFNQDDHRFAYEIEGHVYQHKSSYDYNTWEEAADAGEQKLIELIKLATEAYTKAMKEDGKLD